MTSEARTELTEELVDAISTVAANWVRADRIPVDFAGFELRQMLATVWDSEWYAAVVNKLEEGKGDNS